MQIDDKKFDIALARSGLDKTGVAEKAGMSRQRLMVILNQKRVRPATVGMLAKGLGCDVLDIIADEQ